MRESAPAPAPAKPKPTVGKTIIESPTTVKPSAVVDRQIEEEKIAKGEIVAPLEGRRVCSCGSTEFNAVEDKTKPLHYVSGTPIYAKKHICKRCGKEFK